jgi:major type 1 subunit fimbrin (pilin)
MQIKLAALSLLVFSGVTMAASTNTVEFKGEVGTQTCSVNINGNASNPVILLPTAALSKLSAAGNTTGDTKFTVNVTGCEAPATGTNTSIRTVFVGNNPTSNGNLGNTGDATNVSIQLLDANGTTPLSFASGSASSSAMTLASGTTSISQDLTARYYAESTGATVGTVSATAQFAISYK